ncbi:MAG TPA: helix-turn-helix domain-containing protein [Dinghuibacter sp.]|jgi:DNA-binding HxlR family transcriptional regulator|uniref:winged helix-turn-helix transcriptional regulator n=1 Tax=Dinghuibacter sp. TaxID=2024697 RepID=UPI002C227DF0|nr:helix-turn-helix domain-containing protein [Dinghuibacter sp.]HTJ14182.1 helix-turn-helix domain-containing protein [Dinghuibacter sp.]
MPLEKPHTAQECTAALGAVQDALYAVGGKWKLPVIAALRDRGPQRFNELQRSIKGISARVLSTELKQMELNGFIHRKIDTGAPVVVTYELTPYADTLGNVLGALREWGAQHRNKIRGKITAEVSPPF